MAQDYIGSVWEALLEFNLMRNLFNKLKRCNDGATSIEYGLIAAFIAIGIITGTTAIGTELSNNMQSIATKMAAIMAP